MNTKEINKTKSNELFELLKDNKYFYFESNFYEVIGRSELYLKVNKFDKTPLVTVDFGIPLMFEEQIHLSKFNINIKEETKLKFSELRNKIQPTDYLFKNDYHPSIYYIYNGYRKNGIFNHYNLDHLKVKYVNNIFYYLKSLGYLQEQQQNQEYYINRFKSILKKLFEDWDGWFGGFPNEERIIDEIIRMFDFINIHKADKTQHLERARKGFKFYQPVEEPKNTKYNLKCPLCRVDNTITKELSTLKGLDITCSVCMENKVDQILPNCGHCCLCVVCCDTMKTRI